MCKRNATASWSGYSHQGQVGLLLALRKMQEPGLARTTHYVQFETYEDVAIYSHPVGGAKKYLSVHQVKAYYSATNMYKSTYNGVLNDTFEPGDEKYLHTVAEITDWDTSATTNTNGVLRYLYSGTNYHCGTTEIEAYIKAELNTILGGSALVDTAYQRLCFALDHKIRLEHKKAHKHLFDIKFSFSEIETIVNDTSAFTTKEIADCRKLFYETYRELVQVEDIEETRIDSVYQTIIKDINALNDDDFLHFLQLLNLNETPENLKSTQVAFNKAGLEQVFFRMLIDIEHASANLADKVVKYKGALPANYVVTAIIKEERHKKSVIENIIANLTSQNLLWESHNLVNKEIEAELINENPAIKQIGSEEEKNDDKNRFMRFANTKLVKRDDAINTLNTNGGTT